MRVLLKTLIDISLDIEQSHVSSAFNKFLLSKSLGSNNHCLLSLLRTCLTWGLGLPKYEKGECFLKQWRHDISGSLDHHAPTLVAPRG